MTDRHVRLLAMLARREQRRLTDDERLGEPRGEESAERRLVLSGRAARARARLAAAKARRGLGPRP